jgi:hypothetical protein
MEGQLIPAGLLLTLPEPVPARLTFKGKLDLLKAAVTVCVAFMATTQLPVPLHAPPHPTNADPEDGVAIRETSVPPAKVSAQTAGQTIPAGVLTTLPLPVPARLTFRAKVATCDSKVKPISVFQVLFALANSPAIQMPTPSGSEEALKKSPQRFRLLVGSIRT